MRRRRRRWLAWTLAGVGVLALAGSALAVSYSSLFDASQVVVRGARHVSAAEVRRVSGLEPGVNVVHTDLSKAAERLRSLDWVAGVTISRQLPDVLIVVVRERVPVARATIDGAEATITGDGQVVIGQPADGLPEVRGSVGPIAAEAAAGAGRALAAMDPPVRRRVVSVLVLFDGSLIVEMGQDVIVAWGSASEADEKSAALGAVFDWAQREDAHLVRVDVSVPAAPTAKLAGGVTVLPS